MPRTARHALLALPAFGYAAAVAGCLQLGSAGALFWLAVFAVVQGLFIQGLVRGCGPDGRSGIGPIISFWITLLLGGVLGTALTVELLFLVQGLMGNTRILEALPLLAIGGTCSLLGLLSIPFFDKPGHAGGRAVLRIVALTALAEAAVSAARGRMGPAPTVANDTPSVGLWLGLLALVWCALPYGWLSIAAAVEQARGPRSPAAPPVQFRIGSLLAVLVLLACTLVSLRGDAGTGGDSSGARSAFCGALAAFYLAWRFVHWLIAWEDHAESLGVPPAGR
ncbi:MAG: hypothetical protein HZA54_10365 [Planctomycetes bacterium]|nr:hypothetical protein [Planctomycetota bacterium]